MKADRTITPEFLSGFRHAVRLLGAEGDYRHVDWSEPFAFMETALADQEKLFASDVDRCKELSDLSQAIVDRTKGDMFWIGEILLSELEKETGYKHEARSR